MTNRSTWFIALLWLLVTNLAFAAAPSSASIVLIIEGAESEAQRREVTDAIPATVTVQSPEQLVANLAIQDVTGSVADKLAGTRRKQTLVAVRKALKKVRAPAVLFVRLTRLRAAAREMRVVMLISTQTEPVVDEDVALARKESATPKLSRLLVVPLQDLSTSAAAPDESRGSVEKTGTVEKTGPVGKTSPVEKTASAPAEEAEAVKTEEAAPTEKDSTSKKRGPIHVGNATVIASGGIEVGSRKLEYNDAMAGPLRSYLAPSILSYAFSAQIYPAASSGMSVVKDIGFVARFANAFEFQSKTRDGAQSLSGSWSRYAVGVGGRISTGDKKDPLINVEGTYGLWTFAFAGLDQVVNEVPAVEYKNVRIGADARIPLGAASLVGGAGYMNILSAGPFSTRFPHASIAAIDAMVGAAYAILPSVEAKASVTYTRVFSDARPQVGDANVAGGALDQYLVANVGASALF
jgi:hypothetical protein